MLSIVYVPHFVCYCNCLFIWIGYFLFYKQTLTVVVFGIALQHQLNEFADRVCDFLAELANFILEN